MTRETTTPSLSPTVLAVLQECIGAMRSDEELDREAIGRLEELLLKGVVPKPDEIHRALFDPPKEADQ